MRVIPSFDPAAQKNGTISVGSANEGSKILLYNLSIVNIQISFENGSTALLHAGEANYWILDGTTPTLDWAQYSILNTYQAAISQVTGTVYNPHEEITGTYPMSLTYQLNIGNAIPVSTATNSIINDGNAPATPIVEATPSGDSSSTVQLSNSGVFKLGNATHPGSFSTDNGKVSTDGSGNLTVQGHASLDNTHIVTDGSGNITQVKAITSTGNITTSGTITSSSTVNANGAGTGLSVANNETVGGTLTVNGAISTDAGSITSDGVGDLTVVGVSNLNTVRASHLILPIGGLFAISKFGPYTATTSSASFNHGLGATPDIVIAVIQGTAGGAGALHNVKVDAATYTSTQFNAIADATNVSFVGIAIKF